MSEIAKTYTSRFWAKSDRDGPGRTHLLEHHLADVGACFEALLEQPAIRRRLAHTAGWDDIDSVTAARLGIFAACTTSARSTLGFRRKSGSPAMYRRVIASRAAPGTRWI